LSDIRIFLEDVNQNPPSGQWGGTAFTFNVTVNTTGVDNVTVFLWTGPDSTGPWSQIGQGQYNITPGGWQQLNFTKYFGCDDVDDQKWFFFNATNYNATTNETDPESFEIKKDTLLFTYIQGHASIANRLGSQTDLLSFRIQNKNGTIMNNFPIRYRVTYNNLTFHTDDNL